MTHRREHVRLALLVAACAIVVGLSVLIGHGWQDPSRLFAPQMEGILTLRLWRVALGVVVGASLAAAGAVLQTLLRNPLAEPYVLGISAGSGLALAIGVVVGGSIVIVWQPAFAFVGGVASMLIVYGLARRDNASSAHTLILSGVVWGSLCGSILMFLVSQTDAEGLHTIVWWFLGDLQVFDARLVNVVATLNAMLIVGLVALGGRLDAMHLGDDMAAGLGVCPERTRFVGLLAASALAASCVCAAGLLAFVGLIIPHAARALVGPRHRVLIPACCAIGAAFVVVADGLGRTLLYPQEIPVGIFTSLVGAPFFLLLLRKHRGGVWTE